MFIICPVDVKYKGKKHKAHTQFNCDSSDFQKLFQPLGAWACSPINRKVKESKKEIKESKDEG